MRKVMKPRNHRHRIPTENFSFHEADDRVYELFRNHGVGDVPHERRHQLVRFYLLLMKHQHDYNFTRLVNLREITIKHFVDCLLVPRLAQLKFPLLDMGTGPGFPGIPLKICFPNERIILVEGVQKKVDFLKLVRDELKLENLDIIGRKVDDDFAYPTPGLITRAFFEIPGTLERISSFVPTDGEVYFMKGPNVDSEIRETTKNLSHLFAMKADIPYSIPETPHQRRLVIYRRLPRT